MAYAAVISVLRILNELQDPNWDQIIPHPVSDIRDLRAKLNSLKSFMEENYSLGDLEVKIREAMYDAEDVIEHNLLRYESSSRAGENYMSSFSKKLKEVIGEVDSMKISPQTERPSLPSSSIPELNRKNMIVGREDDLSHLHDRLTKGSNGLEAVPIFGISGIGKTHLARVVYDDQDIMSKFTIHAWVKVSLEYSKKEVLIGLLRSMRKLGTGKGQDNTEDELAKRLSKLLKFGKYLIVLDDVCNPEAWDNLKELLPDYTNGSRVLITTRRKEVAESASNGGPFHQVLPLGAEDSWGLLQSVVFRYKSCPLELKETAERVSASCKGLPLAIVTIGGVLMEATQKDWEIAASTLGKCENCDQLTDAVMLLSYKSLPQHAKACLLYMGIFPDNYEIPVSKLFKLWIAEGFIEKKGEFGSVEEMAGKCLSLLVDRGIILISEFSPTGRPKTCGIGVYRDFLKKKAEEEKFFHVINGYTSHFPDDTCNQGRFCILKNIRFEKKDELRWRSLVPPVRSLLFGGAQEQYPLWVHLDFKLLRVLDAHKIRFYSFPDDILNLVHLRYLALTYNGDIPESICRLWNLQFLMVLRCLSSKYSNTVSRLPLEIWNLNQLRHLQLLGRDLPDPSSTTTPLVNKDVMMNENLLTLLDVSSSSCTPGIFQRIPNLKKLGVRVESPALDAAEDFSFLSYISTLHQLESFKCVVMHPDFGSQVASSIPSFPVTLKKLCLSGCGFQWEYMKFIAALPNLEELKLRWYAFRGPEWKQDQKEFPRLKFLLLEDLDIERWTATRDHFPFLMNLVIRHCYKLREVPTGFGTIPTLKKIELVDCSSSAVKSVQKIKEHQLWRGYIQVDFHSSRDD